MELQENLLIQDVWMQKILIIILYYDNFNITLTLSALYIGVVVVYWHSLLYHLHLTELHADAVYVFYHIMVLPEDGGPG
jgi:hypothetical protein